MIVLVTGAAGFIGSRLVGALAGAGHQVLALDHRPGRVAAAPGVEPLLLDLSDPALASALPGRLDAVMHLAQANVADDVAGAPALFRVNAWSTAQLLEAAQRAGARRFVLASTGSVYGGGDRPWRETDPDLGPGYYAASKVAAERFVRAYGEAGALGITVFRLFVPYGPGQRRLVNALINRVRGGQAVTLKEGRGPRFNPVYLDHVVHVLCQALAAAGNQLLNLGGDEVLSVRQMAETIGNVLGREPVFEDVPGEVGGDVVGDTTELRRHYRLPERLMTFEQGVRAVLDGA